MQKQEHKNIGNCHTEYSHNTLIIFFFHNVLFGDDGLSSCWHLLSGDFSCYLLIKRVIFFQFRISSFSPGIDTSLCLCFSVLDAAPDVVRISIAMSLTVLPFFDPEYVVQTATVQQAFVRETPLPLPILCVSPVHFHKCKWPNSTWESYTALRICAVLNTFTVTAIDGLLGFGLDCQVALYASAVHLFSIWTDKRMGAGFPRRDLCKSMHAVQGVLDHRVRWPSFIICLRIEGVGKERLVLNSRTSCWLEFTCVSLYPSNNLLSPHLNMRRKKRKKVISYIVHVSPNKSQT